MPEKSFDKYLEKRAAERTPDEQAVFDIASAHFETVSAGLDLGAGLAVLRTEAGLTQIELSERSGIAQADISRIERGIGNPTAGTLNRLGDAVGAEVAWVRKTNA